MIAIAIALVGLAAIVALWDGVRRALASQVRLAEIRVEAMQRADYEAMASEVKRIDARINTLAQAHGSLETGLAVGRARR